MVTVLTTRVARRFGHGPLVLVGGLLFAAGMVWRAGFVSVSPDYVGDLLPSQVLGGLGVGLAVGTLIAAGVHALPADRAATGSALVNSVRQISATVGVAVLVAVVGSHVVPDSRVDFRVAWGIAAGLSVLSAAVGVRLSRDNGGNRAPAGARGDAGSTRPLTDAR
ncbi:MFS transporter [Actinoallomurus rhizosphaericola]|uniref:hypothetical protein n=1 Tax=Actinoallomurus rhizosphaericola TaxID=2952536 RepID=UPI0020926D44|nr:hypothetical protein [Actinoallomurus rhizosphaericola]MCO6000091.1 hypothetical protein [Actinoallomurus rhizosphaericola]